MSCIQVKIGTPIISNILVDVSNNFGDVDIDIDNVDNDVTIQVEDNKYKADIDIISNSCGTSAISCINNKADISIGLVCSVGLGVLILCSSDGDLITIDGQYLTISRHAKISS